MRYLVSFTFFLLLGKGVAQDMSKSFYDPEVMKKRYVRPDDPPSLREKGEIKQTPQEAFRKRYFTKDNQVGTFSSGKSMPKSAIRRRSYK
ncbi:MAG: hypothetical protein N2200_06515 [Bacteroidia bacterium]|nr:hypothetical protein [Bacteroidia bacterium]